MTTLKRAITVVAGMVFIAVGAGHLAGTQSVQDLLSAQGFMSTRVQ